MQKSSKLVVISPYETEPYVMLTACVSICVHKITYNLQDVDGTIS